MGDNWVNEERIFNAKRALIYEAYIEKQHPGFLDHYSDTIVDALLDHWKTGKLDRIHAQIVVEKWLIPLLERIPKSNSVIHCPTCGHPIKV